MDHSAAHRVKSFIYPQVGPDFDAWVGICEQRRERQRCVLPAGHHPQGCKFVTASYYTWWRAGGQIPEGWFLVPKDGNWLDIERVGNLEPVTRKRYWQALYARPHRRTERGWAQISGVWHKECTRCGEKKPVEAFPPKRSQCRDCWTETHRRRMAKGRVNHKAEGCVVVNGQHFHIGHLGHKKTPEQREATRVLGFVRYLLEPSGRRPRQAPQPQPRHAGAARRPHEEPELFQAIQRPPAE